MADSIRVFVVEDYKLVRLGTIAALRQADGIDVCGEAETAEEGLDKLKQVKTDVLLLDIGLPGMSGIEMASHVRELAPDTKIIMLTQHDESDVVTAALSAGANAYCLKDIETERLVEVIKTVADGAAWMDPSIAQVAFDIFSNSRTSSSTGSGQKETIEQTLSEREYEVLKRIAQGMSNQEIADELCVSIHTVKAQVSSLLEKLALHDRVQAAILAVKEGIV